MLWEGEAIITRASFQALSSAFAILNALGMLAQGTLQRSIILKIHRGIGYACFGKATFSQFTRITGTTGFARGI